MAIKYLCDPCGKEIKATANRTQWDLDFNSPSGAKVTVLVEALVTINGTTNGGHICSGCIVETVRSGDAKVKVTR